MLMENIQKSIFFLIFHLAHFFCSRVYIEEKYIVIQMVSLQDDEPCEFTDDLQSREFESANLQLI